MHETKPIVFEHAHAPPNPAGLSFIVFLVLGALTFLALVIGFADLGPMKIYANLGVALAQAIVLGLFSMELKNSDKITWFCVAASIFWTFLLFLFTLTDYFTRSMTVWTPSAI